MTSRWQAEKQAIVEIGQEMARKGLVVGSAGNVSLRLAGNGQQLLAITPSREHYQELTAGDIPVIDFEGDPVEGEQLPSTESLLHIGVYRARPDVQAVIHTHSTYASALAVARMELPPVIDELVVLVGGEVKVADYAFPGSDELAENVAAALMERNAALMANHGVVGVGTGLRQALTVCESVERAAQVYVLARSMGRAHLLPEEIVAIEKELFRMAHLNGSPNGQ